MGQRFSPGSILRLAVMMLGTAHCAATSQGYLVPLDAALDHVTTWDTTYVYVVEPDLSPGQELYLVNGFTKPVRMTRHRNLYTDATAYLAQVKEHFDHGLQRVGVAISTDPEGRTILDPQKVLFGHNLLLMVTGPIVERIDERNEIYYYIQTRISCWNARSGYIVDRSIIGETLAPPPETCEQKPPPDAWLAQYFPVFK